jgi:murein L,D-transpeptidase YcbB/YkuD
MSFHESCLAKGALIVLISQAVIYGHLLSQSLSEKVREALRTRIETAEIPPKIAVEDELIHSSTVLPLFYERRIYQPAWSKENGPLPQVDSLIRALQDAHLEGLNAEDYHLEKIQFILDAIHQDQKIHKPLQVAALVDLDLLCTDAFLIYGAHLLSGRVNPVTIHSEWNARRKEADLAGVLEESLYKKEIKESLQSFVDILGYKRIRQALARYRKIAEEGGYVFVPQGPKMQMGDRGERIISLRKRLIASGDLPSGPIEDESSFDLALDRAVRRFQNRYGLDVDGVVGPASLKELNIPVEDRIQQIVVNMERWRWLPQTLGTRYILVNIANFELEVVEDGQIFISMRAVVGRPYRRTPVFSDKMSCLVFNPYWNVPKGIAAKDILPAVRKNIDYLKEKDIRVYQGWGAEAKEIDPQTIDWSKVTAANIPYRFRQDPGPSNALGRVKFMFPNPYDVYLHDTPARELFSKTERAFSSGCIRVEKAVELAEYVLQGDSKWSHSAIVAAMDRGVEQTIRLPALIDVHLLYWTAWVEEEGTIHFRRDIYERDKALYKALIEESPER